MAIKTRSKLITSYKIKIAKLDTDGNPSGELVEIGQLRNMNVSESRNMIDNFTIGNLPSSGTPQEIVPGILTTRQITADYISLYTKNALEDIGRVANISSLGDQEDPFVIQEIIVDPSENAPTKIKQYNDCFISSYSETKNIDGGDIRVLESVTIVYKNVTYIIN